MKELLVILAFTVTIVGCSEGTGSEFHRWWGDCQSRLNNRHLGNFLCPLHSLGRIVASPYEVENWR